MTQKVVKIPRVTFKVERLINEFCHLSVLYADCLTSELSGGMLGNKSYQQQNASHRQETVLQRLQNAGPLSPESWYSLARTLMRTNSLEEAGPSQGAKAGVGTVLIESIRQGAEGYEEIWLNTSERMKEYMRNFEAVWNPIGGKVLSNMSSLAKADWIQKDIQVHFVDCLWGGFAWTDCIAFTPFPDLEVQKKFLAHEFSELMTPGSVVSRALASAGIRREITHTIVDMIAYFSVRDFIAKPVYPNPERRGTRPNPNYYPLADELYPFFEHYSQNPNMYGGIEELMNGVVATLKSLSSENLAQAA